MNTTPKMLSIVAAALVIGAAIGFGLARFGSAGTHAAAGASVAAGHAAGVSAAASAPGRKVLYWYDPMVPTQKFDQPGKSPFMDMQLVPRYADEADAGGGVAVSPQAVQSLGVRLATVDQQRVGARIDAVGTVQLNERDVAVLQARTAGFVERVVARAPGDVIAAGAPLADVLNPEWLAAQHEYLAVKRTGDARLTQAARSRLMLLGMPEAMVERADRSGTPQALQTLTAPIGGVITELALRPGMTLAAGMTLARINGLATVWLEVALPEAQAAGIAPGQPVQAHFPALGDAVVHGKVAAILPEANRDTRTLRLRIELPNRAQRLRAGLFARVRLTGPQHQALTVPAEAVIRTGRHALVYVVEAPGRYRPVQVQLGEQFGDRLEIRQGLAAGQQVVASGQFLIDSEASLQGVLARSAEPASAGASALAMAVHETRGTVVAIEPGSITLDHEPVPALKWPQMVMSFKLADPGLARSLKQGQSVAFGFEQRDGESVVVRIAPAASAAAPGAAK